MRERPKTPGLEKYKENIEEEFLKILRSTEKMKTKESTMKNLDDVLKSMKKGQSRDSKGLTNELFLMDNIGSNLKESILMLANKMKNTKLVPDFFRATLISSIPKKVKSPLNLDKERGIFLIHKVRSIAMKLIYNSMNEDIEGNLSESNIGARKGRSPRDNLFILKAIINDVLQMTNANVCTLAPNNNVLN